MNTHIYSRADNTVSAALKHWRSLAIRLIVGSTVLIGQHAIANSTSTSVNTNNTGLKAHLEQQK